MRTLVALGPRATVRPYLTEQIGTRADRKVVTQLYSVTFDQDGRRTTFLVRLVMRRLAAGRPGWQIIGLNGGVRPTSEEEEQKYWLVEK